VSRTSPDLWAGLGAKPCSRQDQLRQFGSRAGSAISLVKVYIFALRNRAGNPGSSFIVGDVLTSTDSVHTLRFPYHKRGSVPPSAEGYWLLVPVEAKRAATTAAKGRKSFALVASELIDLKRQSWRRADHQVEQWRNSLIGHAAIIARMPIDQVDTAAIMSVLRPLQRRFPDAAARTRGRIEAVINYAVASGYRDGILANPARLRGHLEYSLQAPLKADRHHNSMPYADIPSFIRELRSNDSTASLALQYLILSATRLNETLEAEWQEIDLTDRLWSIPAARMKMASPFRVPLSLPMVDILTIMATRRDKELIFPSGRKRGRPLAGSTLKVLCPAGITRHGFRSSFRTWAAENTDTSFEIGEAALAHRMRSSVARAYLRTDYLEQRRSLMEGWAVYCFS
jgi:integrase